MNSEDMFYFYNTAIGDLTELIHKYAIENQTGEPGFIRNAFGVKVNCRHIPQSVGRRWGGES